MHNLFATCNLGLEYPLELELIQHGASNVVSHQGGVAFQAELPALYRILLWSRVASRVLLVVAEGKAQTGEDIAQLAYEQDWTMLIRPTRPFTIEFVGSNRDIRNTGYGAQCVKDGISKLFADEGFARPHIDNRDPEAIIRARIGGSKLTLMLDLTGRSLHLRGYRTEAGAAPLREPLAAAMIIRSGWLEDTSVPLLDPMCGSGTLLIEAASMAAGIAPGIENPEFSVHRLPMHSEQIWQEALSEATVKSRRGLNQVDIEVSGQDQNPEVIIQARANARRAGVENLINFKQLSLADNPLTDGELGFIVCNPPYGERLGDEAEIVALYFQLGEKLRQNFNGHALLVTSADDYVPALKLRSDKTWQVMNGKLPCQLMQFSVKPSNREPSFSVTPNGSEFANRLKKNLQRIDKWAKKVPTDAYRVYDADLPEYNVAIDKYLDKLVIQEYAPPKSIDAEKAARRLLDVILIAPELTGINTANVFIKRRKSQSGSNQYEKVSTRNAWQVVHEYGLAFKVNLSDYLDTGLFLDHRVTRHEFAKLASGKRFLNLFCYTGSATVHAVNAGATHSVSVDMSKTYLEWARENLVINRLISPKHTFEHADVLKYLKHTHDKFDVVFCDPPTFSNSKRMKDTLDIQRDHIDLLTLVDGVLEPGGVVMFSNNNRRFKLDSTAIEAMGYTIKDWNRFTLPEDFKRNPNIHHCWLLEKNA
ncbi:bifunctional 23S rRNA (guanine(2069)-N(7))-methyltransferase RlmK/23S rRNA (guanine(2445)-N(2))-methyltransferase RlmL [Echinimonas agarilytica]|uniref:Ribosomal RNA large subunit methyltransferase K/L n=1 Tax=Echinimonas agarilytica TaxID=1215918 RepID=A0AA41W8T3_9GAMM|nr:bifunctional 23S rRNA (guanine(2069)-N(7))-methyltransferase RlmK/23S rRNA (guanine(2445)-N(2))-methyltransferase RlmL [Echinimonas agarilytica]